MINDVLGTCFVLIMAGGLFVLTHQIYFSLFGGLIAALYWESKAR